jgi:pimeloyl-ACP methyl ester carboxylesterase
MNKKVKKFLVFSACATAGIYYANRVLNYTATLKNLLTDDNGDYYKWKNGDVFYTVHGNGEPLLLIHDLHPASSSTEWSKIMKRLEKSYTVYSIDLPGCGRSDKPSITFTNYYFVQLLNDFVKDVIGKKTKLIATGASGSFSIMANAMNPDNYDKVIVINPESLESLTEQPNKLILAYKHLLDTPIFGTFIYNIKMHENSISKLFREKYYFKPTLVSTKLEDTYFEAAHIGHGTGRHLLSSICANYTNISVAHVLPKLDNIYLIQSRELPSSMKIIDGYTRQNDKLETAYISNSKYLPQLEVPEKLAEILNMFLTDETK